MRVHVIRSIRCHQAGSIVDLDAGYASVLIGRGWVEPVTEKRQAPAEPVPVVEPEAQIKKAKERRVRRETDDTADQSSTKLE